MHHRDKVGDFSTSRKGPRLISLAEVQSAGDQIDSEIHLNDDDFVGSEELWKMCIVGRLLGVRLDAYFVQQATQYHFRRCSGIEAMEIGDNAFLINQYGS